MKKFILRSRDVVKNGNDELQIQQYTQLVDKIAKTFIGDLYSQIMINDGIYSGNKGVIPFYKFIAFTLPLVTTI